MTINGVNPNVNQNYAPVQKKRSGGAGKAIASTFIPGLGQFCDGRNKDGFKYLGGVVGTFIASKMLMNSFIMNIADIVKDGGKKLGVGTKARYIGAGILGMAAFGTWVANIVDAYNGRQ